MRGHLSGPFPDKEYRPKLEHPPSSPAPSMLMDATRPAPPPLAWQRLAWSRMKTGWVIKMVASALCLTAFFIGYFWLLNHPRFAPTTIPRIFVDRLVPFWSWAVILYLSLWLYVLLAPALLTSRREMAAYVVAVFVLSMIGFCVFFLWPTSAAKAEMDLTSVRAVAFLKSMDASGNAFPSLHVAFAVFTAFWFERLLRKVGAGVPTRAFTWLWCLGIIYSTLAIRQHVALDAMAGAVLGAGVAFLHMRLLGSPKPGPS